MATRGNCKKFGRSPKTGKCRKGPATGGKRKSSSSGSKKRGNCAKWGKVTSGARKGLCRKGPPSGGRKSRGGVDDSVRAAMRASIGRTYS